jgi:hypothetical protein
MFIKNTQFPNESFPEDAIEVKTAGRISFNPARLAWHESERLEEVIKAQYPNYQMYIDRRGSLFYDANPRFRKPEVVQRMKDVFNTLSEFDKVDFSTYGTVTVKVDFLKLIGSQSVLENSDYGILFVSDSYVTRNRSKGAVKYGYKHGLEIKPGGTFRNIEPISETSITFDSTFDSKGTIIIYAVNDFIEKIEGEFWPSLRLVQIPVRIVQNPNDPAEMYSQINIRGIRTPQKVVEDIIPHILKPVLSNLEYFNLKKWFAYDLVGAMGADEKDYEDFIESHKRSIKRPGTLIGDQENTPKKKRRNKKAKVKKQVEEPVVEEEVSEEITEEESDIVYDSESVTIEYEVESENEDIVSEVEEEQVEETYPQERVIDREIAREEEESKSTIEIYDNTLDISVRDEQIEDDLTPIDEVEETEEDETDKEVEFPEDTVFEFDGKDVEDEVVETTDDDSEVEATEEETEEDAL